jgi:hypothetical protein
MKRHPVLAVVLAVVLSACAGPKAKLDFSGKAIAIDVAFGSPKGGQPGAVDGPVRLQAGPGGFGVVPVPTQPGPRPPSTVPLVDLPPPAPVAACPEVDPFKFPRQAVDTQVRRPAIVGAFPYRVRSTVDTGGATSDFSGDVVQRVSNAVTNSDGSYGFTVESQGQGGVVTTQRYVAQPATDTLPGLVGIASDKAAVGGQTYSYSSPKALKLLQLRPTASDSWDDATHDPTSATTVTTQAITVGTDRVNACGQPIDAWKVTSTENIVTPNERVQLSVTRWIATEYGGLVVAESYSFDGTVSAGNTHVQGTYSAIINIDPGAQP